MNFFNLWALRGENRRLPAIFDHKESHLGGLTRELKNNKEETHGHNVHGIASERTPPPKAKIGAQQEIKKYPEIQKNIPKIQISYFFGSRGEGI